MDVDHVVAPRTGAAWQVGAGEVVRLIDLEGGQTGDLFMNSRVDGDGRLRIDPPLCRAGDALTLRLERECFVAVTACPASLANGGGGGGPLGVAIGPAVAQG